MKKTLCQMALAIALGLACAMVLTLVPSCSSPRPPVAAKARAVVPECDDVQMQVVNAPSGRYFVFDEANFTALVQTTRAIQRGKCRVPLDE